MSNMKVLWTRGGTLLKTMMKLSRYNANGTTHSRGIAARSVDRYVVTPNSKLAGINASAIQ